MTGHLSLRHGNLTTIFATLGRARETWTCLVSQIEQHRRTNSCPVKPLWEDLLSRAQTHSTSGFPTPATTSNTASSDKLLLSLSPRLLVESFRIAQALSKIKFDHLMIYSSLTQ